MKKKVASPALGNPTTSAQDRPGIQKSNWQKMRWYERATALAGLTIIVISAAAWWCGPHTVEWAIHISEPAFLAVGALSIILLWAQLRAASAQEHEENVWKRIMCLHEHFKDIPRLERSEPVRKYLLTTFPNRAPPSAYFPLTDDEVAKIMADRGDAGTARGDTLIYRYLNDWEDFCGAISVGVVDEDYARSMEGGRLIDAFFGYRKVIEAYREKHTKAQQSADPNAASAFAHVAYTELQDVAIRWHEIRHNEKMIQDARIAAADELADSIRRGVKSGVTPKAKPPLD
jgi:hypothetical protein